MWVRGRRELQFAKIRERKAAIVSVGKRKGCYGCVAVFSDDGGGTMNRLKPRIHDEVNGLDYVLVGDC